MNDIESRQDLEFLLSEFYEIAVTDDEIGHHFDDLDLKAHLPVIVDFWEKVLFGKPIYFGNPLAVHKILNKKLPLKREHFDRWVTIFSETIDRYFSGAVSENAKQRAGTIAASLRMNLNDQAKPVNLLSRWKNNRV